MSAESIDINIWKDLLPNFDIIDGFLKDLLPNGRKIGSMDLVEDVLKGNWVLEPSLFWDYIKETLVDFLGSWKSLFVCIIALFILSAIVSSFLLAFKNDGAAKVARLFFVLCQIVVLINAFKDVLEIATETMAKMIEFLKVIIPAYMICIAATGSGLTALIFYKLLVGFLCLIEGIVVAALAPVVEGYVLLGIIETIWSEERFKGLMELIKKCVQWGLKTMIVLLSGSGILQIIITPVLDKANVSVIQKTAGAIPGIGDIAESVSSITLASAIALKNSMGVMILLVIILIITAPVIRIAIILGTIKLGGAIGGICGEKQMINCVDYISEAGILLLRMLITVTTLFFITIAAVTSVTGGGL